MADTTNTTNTTTVHTAEVVRYDDPMFITDRVADAAFIAGYTDPTRRSYATECASSPVGAMTTASTCRT